MKYTWRKLCATGLVSVIVAAMLMSVPMVVAKGPKPPPVPADPAIAFFLQTSGPKPNKLMVMNADGSNQAAVYEAYFICHGISWSPDGKSLAWSGIAYIPNVPSDDYGVWRLDIDVVDGKPQGSNLQRLVTSTDFLTGAAWSPLGDEIAFAVWTIPRTQDEIQVVPANGGPTESIYVSPSYFMTEYPTWSSDGTRIAFIEEHTWIKVIERETKVITHAFDMGEDVTGLDWARQGSNIIAYQQGPRIYTLDIDSGTSVPIVGGAIPSWSPDNSKFVYLQLGAKTRISIYELSTGDITPLTNGGTRPDWRRF